MIRYDCRTALGFAFLVVAYTCTCPALVQSRLDSYRCRVVDNVPRDWSEVTADIGSERAKARIEQIKASHLDRPEVSERMKPYYEPWNDPLDKLRPLRRGRPWQDPKLRPPALEFLHPRYRALAARHQGTYAQLTEVVKGFRKRVNDHADQRARAGQSPRDSVALERFQQEYDKALSEVRTIYQDQVPADEFELLCDASGCGWPRSLSKLELDAKYALTWEEVLLRSEAWVMKQWYVWIIIRIDDPGAIPVLGETLRQAIEAKHTYQTGYILDSVRSRILEAFARRPTRETLLELSDTIRLLEGERKRDMQRWMGARVLVSQDWLNLLGCLETDPETATHVACLREAAVACGRTDVPGEE